MTGLARPARESAFTLPDAEVRRLGHRIADLVADYFTALPDRPVFRRMTEDERRRLMDGALPEHGQDPDAILDFLEDALLPFPMGAGHPRYFGWVNSAPDRLAALTEALAAAINPSCASGDHGAIYLEHAVIRWLGELVGFPADGSNGLLVSGGSMASLTALAAARHGAARADGWDVRTDGIYGDGRRLLVYLSGEAHNCIRKAAELLGLGTRSLRLVPTDAAFRLDPAALTRMLALDRAAGHRPFCVVASAGTVNTGTVDDLAALAEQCAEEALWLHVDGAYGALGCLDPAAAPLFDGLGRVDSLAIDPHKWLSVPIECGCVLVRDGALLREAFESAPAYLPTESGRGFANLPGFDQIGFQQTRGFRALKLWVTLMHVGRAGLAASVARNNALARHLAAAVDAAPRLEATAPVTLSVVCFRYVPPGPPHTPGALDQLNRAIMDTVQEEGEAFLSGTVLDGRFSLRACVLNYATGAADVDRLVEVVVRVGERLGASGA